MHKKKAGKLQTGNTFPKQYWLAVNGKPKKNNVSPFRKYQNIYNTPPCHTVYIYGCTRLIYHCFKIYLKWG